MGISIWQLLIVLVIVLLLFGTRRLRDVGADLGAAIKSFKNALGEGETESPVKSKELAQIEAQGGTERQVEEKPERPQRQPLEP
ncbi:Sec-independent protein translocase subunit TatA [Methylothermus subterraneus]